MRSIAVAYSTGQIASGRLASGARVRFMWIEGQWRPIGAPDAPAQAIGPLSDYDMRGRVFPDLLTAMRLGGVWRDHTTGRMTRLFNTAAS